MGGFVAKELQWKDPSHLEDSVQTEEGIVKVRRISVHLLRCLSCLQLLDAIPKFCQKNPELSTTFVTAFEWETTMTVDDYKGV